MENKKIILQFSHQTIINSQKKINPHKAPKGLSNAELKRLNRTYEFGKILQRINSSQRKEKKVSLFVKGILKDVTKQSLTEAGKKIGQ